MIYRTASIRTAQYIKLSALPIEHQKEILAATGEELNLPRTVELLREATDNFKREDNTRALKVDELLHRLLVQKGFFGQAEPTEPTLAPAPAADAAALFGGAAAPAPAPQPDAAAAKAKRIRIAKMEAEAALMRVRVLKLKAQAQAAQNNPS